MKLGTNHRARILRGFMLGLLCLALGMLGGRGLAAGFTRLDAVTQGVAFTNRIATERHLTNQIPLNGSGVALGDVDGDGLADLVFGGLGGGTTVFLNRGGWRFEKGVDAKGLGLDAVDVTGVALVDLDGDGTSDLVVNTLMAGTWLFSNDGKGVFTRRVELNPRRAGMSLAVADLDGDGDLDLYVANYRGASVRDEPGGKFTVRDEGQGPRVTHYNGRPTTDEDLVGRFTVGGRGIRENGEPDAVYLNDGGWKFRAASWTDGTFLDEEGQPLTGAYYDWGLSVMARDLTGDGLPDLYVCNDFESPDRFWVNRTVAGGPMRFQLVSMLALRVTSAFSMGVDAADVDRDGVMDFFVADMLSRDHGRRNTQVAGLPPSMSQPGVFEDRPQFSRNMLFRGRGDGTFSEVGRMAGVAASEWSWTPMFLDVDLDGYEDLLVSNGHELDMMDVDVGDAAEVKKASKRMTPREQLEMRREFVRLNTPNAAFRNRGGLRFEDASKAWNFDVPEVGNGMAAGDLDGDGDLDVVVNNLNAVPTLYRNDAAARRLGVRLMGLGRNTRGLGARIVVRGGPVALQQQEMVGGGRYLSSDEPLRVFAAGTAAGLDVEVLWRTGKRTVLTNVSPDRVCVVREADAIALGPVPSSGRPWFTDVSDRVPFQHHENVFDDGARQPLLWGNGSQMGPGVTWADADGDGMEDLWVGAGAGGLPGLFLGDGRGGFRRWIEAPLQKPAGRDMTAWVPFPPLLMAGSSNYEDGATHGGLIRIFDLARRVSGEAVLGQKVTAGPLAVADADGEPGLEIVVGGRARPGGYPEGTPSLLLRANGGRLVPAQSIVTGSVVNDALWVDLDGDGRSELVLTSDGGPVRILGWKEGRLDEVTAAWGVGELTGWWSGVAAGDFDGDGRMDLLVGNRGLNLFPNAPDAAHPWTCRWGDLDGSGALTVWDSYTGADGNEWPLRRYDAVVQAMPGLKETFPTRAAFGRAKTLDVLGKRAGDAGLQRIVTAASMLFLNRGGRFETRVLPDEVQCAPVFGVATGDFDGDGKMDAFVAQNFFPVHPGEGRQDAGCGVVLRGDGRGGFVALSPGVSGIAIHGEGRGVAAGDFDRDGRLDLAVGQNGAALRLFRNAEATASLRVRLQGDAANPTAVGAQLRWIAGGQAGPVQVVRMGGGWWSCPSPVLLVPMRRELELEVRWPGGRVTRGKVPDGAKEVTVGMDGKLGVLP